MKRVGQNDVILKVKLSIKYEGREKKTVSKGESKSFSELVKSNLWPKEKQSLRMQKWKIADIVIDCAGIVIKLSIVVAVAAGLLSQQHEMLILTFKYRLAESRWYHNLLLFFIKNQSMSYVMISSCKLF